ncbi:MAG: peptidoglycan DD-metalloendopeptidase family protein [Bacteroidaceae bacterium]|nr:peptidoglycan DD-metalloendopeptidase family protein [Bacteroidaceae bacterium]
MKSHILRIVSIVVLMGVSVLTFAQDLLAEQAPMDRQMARIDSVVLSRLIKAELYEYPADDLYPEWSNDYAHKYGNVAMPDSLLIDLTGFCMPTENTKVNDIFGYRPRRRRVHYGLDIKVERGDTIRAAFDGKVRYVSYQRRGYGHYVVIRHPNGLETLYAHLNAKLVAENEVVKAGDPIGLGGNTGRSTGPHLHFETRLLGKALNPALFFDFPNQDVTGDTYLYVKPKKKVYDPSDPDTYYKVRSGDTLSRIAANKGVSVKQLCKLNGITTQSTLRVGQVLRLY